jgi:hypothetical protein
MAGAGWKRAKEAESGRWRWKRAMGACLERKKQKAGNEELQRALGLAWAGVGRRRGADAETSRRADEQTGRRAEEERTEAADGGWDSGSLDG